MFEYLCMILLIKVVNMINILNEFIINYAMTLATVFMAVATFLSVNEMKKTRKESNKAHVIAYFKLRGHKIDFVIKNHGLTEARNVKISSVPNIEGSESNITIKSLFENLIPFFPPQMEIRTFFDMAPDYIDKIAEHGKNFPDYYITISYEDIYFKKHDYKYKLNLKYIHDVGWLGNEHQDIQTSLSVIADYTKFLKKKK